MVSGLITFLGSMVTYVVLPFQVKEITGSYVAVGLLGAIEIVPLVIFGLYGGTLADAIDRKKMVVLMEVASLVLTTILLINSLLPHPKLWVLYVVAGIFAAVDGLARPSLDAMIPRILPHDQMMAASALRSVRWQFGAVLGPVIGGILITWKGVNAGYIFDVITYAVSILLLIRLAPSPAEHDSPAPSLSSLMEGVRYAMSRKDLMGTYAVDLAAMFFAMPMALFPFFADEAPSPMGPRFALLLDDVRFRPGHLYKWVDQEDSPAWMGNSHRSNFLGRGHFTCRCYFVSAVGFLWINPCRRSRSNQWHL